MPKLTVETIRLSGFRGYAGNEEFSLSKNNNPAHLVIYGRNAKGKSGLTDALEFYFSREGIVERFKTRETPTTPGRRALINDKSEALGRAQEVEVRLREDGKVVHGSTVRQVVDAGDAAIPLPEMARRVRQMTHAPFVIRGWELRQFVEQWSAHDVYQQIAQWFSLDRLADIVETLRQVRLDLESQAENESAGEAALSKIVENTNNTVSECDESAVVTWFNENILDALQAGFRFGSLAKADSAYQQLLTAKRHEDEKVGLAQLTEAISALDGGLGTEDGTDEHGHAVPAQTGAFDALESAVADGATASAQLDTARSKHGQAYLSKALEAAEATLQSGEARELDKCFVCGTEFAACPHGSREGVLLHLRANLRDLQDYRDTEQAAVAARTKVERTVVKARSTIELIMTTLRAAELESTALSLQLLKGRLDMFEVGSPAPQMNEEKLFLESVRHQLRARTVAIKEEQGENTFGAALQIFDNLYRAKEEFEEAMALKHALTRLSASYATIESAITSEIAGHTQGVLDDLRDDVAELYEMVLREEAPTLNIVLPDPAGSRRHDRVYLQIDFSDTRLGVIPQGYLSDSQLHTLALCYRLAAARRFNKGFAAIVLDDVMTSYDYGHKLDLVKMLVDKFSECQLIIATHDDGFYRYLRSAAYGLPQKRTNFRWIENYDRELGPIFAGFTTSDEQIEQKHNKEESAVNEMRQAIEGWLNEICRDLGVRALLPPIDNPGDYSKHELASGLGGAIKKLDGYNEVGNRTVQGLVDGTIENLGSHFQVDGTRDISVEDAKTYWSDFKTFKALFVCPRNGCDSTRFRTEQRRGAKPRCVKCGAEFRFSVACGT